MKKRGSSKTDRMAPTSLVDAWTSLCDEVERTTGQDVRKVLVAEYGWARSTVYAWQELNGDTPRQALPALAVQQATSHFGKDTVLKALCGNIGYICIRVPERKCMGAVDLRAPIRRGAEAVEAYLAALEDDGVIDRTEADEEIVPAIDEAIAAFEHLRAQVQANAKNDEKETQISLHKAAM